MICYLKLMGLLFSLVITEMVNPAKEQSKQPRQTISGGKVNLDGGSSGLEEMNYVL